MSLYAEFNASGLCVIPLKKGVPLVQWSPFFYTLPTPEQAAKFTGDEYGLVCGKASGVVALDIDTDDATTIALVERLAGVSPVRKRGSKGYTAFFRYGGEASASWKREGKVIVELLSDKRITTIPPSKHRTTGKPYAWDGEPLHSSDSLPLLSEDFTAFMDVKFPPPKHSYAAIPRDATMADVGIEQAREMLGYIQADAPRDEWVQVGMALRDEFGDAARGLWHDWSATGGAKYNQREAEACWRSFTGGGITIGTLVHFAKRGGWRPQREVTQREAKKSTVERVGPATITPDRSITPGSLPSGMVKAVAQWITDTAIVPQPELSIAAAICFVGMVKGYRVCSPLRDGRTNLLVLSLAPTGGGKEHPQYCVDRLAVACGLERNMMGRPSSGTALLRGLEKTGGCGLLTVDEMGRYLGNITMKSAGGYQREIVDYMVELYSCSNRTFRGRQYANDKENPQIIIEQPHFCCLGSTVPERLAAACTSAEVIDGFLNRWLVFHAKSRPEKRLHQGAKREVPAEVVQVVRDWIDRYPIRQDAYGKPTPSEIEFTPEAWQMFLAFEKQAVKMVESEPYPMNELYVRAGEQVAKLATVFADSDWIGTPELKAAIAVVTHSNQNIRGFASSIVNSAHESNVLYVLDVIARAGEDGISRENVTYRTRKLNNRERTDIINQLVESGEVEAVKEGKKVVFRKL